MGERSANEGFSLALRLAEPKLSFAEQRLVEVEHLKRTF